MCGHLQAVDSQTLPRVGVPQVHLPHVHITFVRAYNADGDARAHGHTDVQETGFRTQKVLRLLSTARLNVCGTYYITKRVKRVIYISRFVLSAGTVTRPGHLSQRHAQLTLN